MTARFDLVTLDAAQPDRIASFWAAALDLVEVEREDGDRWIVLAERTGVRRIGVQRGAPRGASVHLDLACPSSAFDDEVDRLVALGARVVGGPRTEQYGSIVNLVDPEGTPFDLCAYTR
jgi:predicted enzyme related to lactoylglutathione lyase